MGVIKKLIRKHRVLFFTAVFLTFLSVFLNLCWNKFLMELLDGLGDSDVFPTQRGMASWFWTRVGWIVLLHTISEFASTGLASCVCERFAHDLRMGYVRYYLQNDVRTLSALKAGEEQSAMQNELKDISDYFRENLFSFLKQFAAFGVTALFLLRQNPQLALVSTLPAFPLMAYCSYTGRIIKGCTERCQRSKKQINGLADVLLELFPVIQVYDAYSLIRHAMSRRILDWQSANIRREKISASLMSLSGLLSFLPLLLLLGFGGTMVLRGRIGIGTFYIFINLSGCVSGFLQNMPNIYAGFRRFEASLEGLGDKLVFEKQKENARCGKGKNVPICN